MFAADGKIRYAGSEQAAGSPALTPDIETGDKTLDVKELAALEIGFERLRHGAVKVNGQAARRLPGHWY